MRTTKDFLFLVAIVVVIITAVVVVVMPLLQLTQFYYEYSSNLWKDLQIN